MFKIAKVETLRARTRKRRQAQAAVEGSKSDIAWGSQIRSYVLHPYKMVKDHRTNYESRSPDDVLDGDIEEFINEFLAKAHEGKKSN